MTILTARSLKKDFGIKEIITDGNFSLNEGDKVGLIGTNGSGKSTILKIIAGFEPINSGEIWRNAKAQIAYLPQQPEVNENYTVLEQVFAHSSDEMALVREYEAISIKLEQTSQPPEDLLTQLSRITQRMEAAGAWELETNAKIILDKLGIKDLDAKVGSLSGGYRKRIALASALLSTPDLLLMDEPTNHLDALSVEWLQSYLNSYQGALLLITHDRYFLDRVTNRIIEIDRGNLYTYSGNYAYYLEKKAAATEMEASSQHKFTGVLRRELQWLQRGPKARSTKQKARIDRIGEMQTQEFQADNAKVAISTTTRRIGKKVIELEHVSKSYGEKTLIRDFSYVFTPFDRVGIIGSNGAGKSTLMEIMIGKVAPDSGNVAIGSTIHIGYFDQHSTTLAQNQEQRVIEYLKDVAELVKTSDGSIITASQMLERFLFPPNQQYSPIHKLSGGEKRRLFLLEVLMRAPNVLILDEPTNDLDVQTLGVLEDYLEDFPGCVIVVSHDRYFLDRTVETIFAFESEGKLRQYPGNYSVYLEIQKTEAVAEKPTKIFKAKPPKSQPQAIGKLSSKEKREYQGLEAKIEVLEAEKAKLEDLLYNHPPADFNQVQTLSENLAKLAEAIETATLRWLELAEKDS
ncbi:ABC-F family ATP-binding cassette domain-containing protein [Gloeocapsa sp. PCC 73106]|uniref:ABC-F family ATP-binding cassette domain-containing protein n=1 Tax=Gloeocapsa sp. PCC 73106 TaxID=102232 RepID=UPI0002AC71D3|nr:ABC-F family ATP-binding cassette domain-containing protein [Gloeocapsa sp. PCC 73106]ELR99122.1 ATPase component of ABC transporters with duplicated ATPase domain [Gloeocapsa sp. PCC 73106]